MKPLPNANTKSVVSNFGVERLGLNFIPIAKDGHCLYRAASLYLEKDVSILRNEVADQLENNLEHFASFLVLSEGRSLNDYINAVRSSNEWADQIEIEILMNILDQPILIVGPNNQLRNPQDRTRFTGEPIFVRYNGHNHYDGLVLQEGRDAQFVLTQLEQVTAMIELQPITQISEHSHYQSFFRKAAVKTYPLLKKLIKNF